MPEKYLNQIRDTLKPSGDLKKRVKMSMEAKIGTPAYLEMTKKALSPRVSVKKSVWNCIQESIRAGETSVLLDRVRAFLTPSPVQKVSMKEAFLASLRDYEPAPVGQSKLKWVAAFAVFMILANVGSSFFAPVTHADSNVIIIPTSGETFVSVSGYWAPVTEEMVVTEGMMLKTEGEATLIFHDRLIARMGENTTVRIDDISRRTDLSAQYPSTMTVYTGDVWALAASSARSFDIATTYGTASINHGSILVSEENGTFEVFDGRAIVLHGHSAKHLVTGEATTVTEKTRFTIRKMKDDRFENEWVVQNLERDAVHREYIAQMQRERRIARAGIVRTSPLYPVKQLARSIQEFVTVNEDEKVQLQLDHANELLDEASALLAEGETEAMELTLADYRDSLQAVASGSGEGSLVQFYIEEALVEAADDTATALPTDEDYLIKKAVLEATETMADGDIIGATDVQEILIVDAVTALMRAVDNGNTAEVQMIWSDIQPQIAILDNEVVDISPESRKQAKVLLSEFAYAVQGTEGFDEVVVTEVAEYLPPQIEEVAATMNADEIAAVAMEIRGRIFNYHMTKSRLNQWNTEKKALVGHPEQGRILRYLYNHEVLPHGPENFPELVRREFVRLQWERAI